MEELTGFGMKNNSTLPSLATYFFNSLGDQNDEPIYTFNDEYMRFFERKSLKVGRCANLKIFFNLSFLTKWLLLSEQN